MIFNKFNYYYLYDILYSEKPYNKNILQHLLFLCYKEQFLQEEKIFNHKMQYYYNKIEQQSFSFKNKEDENLKNIIFKALDYLSQYGSVEKERMLVENEPSVIDGSKIVLDCINQNIFVIYKKHKLDDFKNKILLPSTQIEEIYKLLSLITSKNLAHLITLLKHIYKQEQNKDLNLYKAQNDLKLQLDDLNNNNNILLEHKNLAKKHLKEKILFYKKSIKKNLEEYKILSYFLIFIKQQVKIILNYLEQQFIFIQSCQELKKIKIEPPLELFDSWYSDFYKDRIMLLKGLMHLDEFFIQELLGQENLPSKTSYQFHYKTKIQCIDLEPSTYNFSTGNDFLEYINLEIIDFQNYYKKIILL